MQPSSGEDNIIFTVPWQRACHRGRGEGLYIVLLEGHALTTLCNVHALNADSEVRAPHHDHHAVERLLPTTWRSR